MSVQAYFQEVAMKFAAAALSRSGGQLDAGMNRAFQALVDAGVSKEQFNEAMKRANHDYVVGLLNSSEPSFTQEFHSINIRFLELLCLTFTFFP